jgi:GNAT superfamily N-acetyltransferase
MNKSQVLLHGIMNVSTITYLDAGEEMKYRIETEWGEKPARHMHLSDGFSIVALDDDTLVGLISVYWKKLPSPLQETLDGYIDILEVHKDFRRKGIARRLIEITSERAKATGMFQIRSWSSEDKIEAIPMWRALGFGLCPATTYPHGQEVKGYFVAKVL